MRAAAIIPAYNEAKTVGDVVRTVAASKMFAEIVVVSDGSTDDTSRIAKEAGATLVHEMPWKHGKGAAMGHGVMHADAEAVCFFDADLRGLTVEHVRLLLEPVLAGERYMNVGLRDRGPFWTALMKALPLVGGERALRREIFDAIPEIYLHGFKVESALNYFCRVNGLPYGTVVLPGLGIVRKIAKVGWLRGLRQYLGMWLQVATAMLQVRLAAREFRERGTHMSHKHR
ncbi:glycosyltransferase family 2 protein [Candidatus Uhrbacteria bacterium]|nr:glycosyltransferase family 2 protein [Candidatus Uhrbacteria bacterium]